MIQEGSPEDIGPGYKIGCELKSKIKKIIY